VQALRFRPNAVHYATAISTRLQPALDDRRFVKPEPKDLCAALNQGKARLAFAVDPVTCPAPYFL
jgi:fumarylacetoacetate (FAA) hydrolase